MTTAERETPPINPLGCIVLMGFGVTLLVIDWALLAIDWVARLEKFVKLNRREKQG